MFRDSLIIGGLNPIHMGHILLMRATLRSARHVDVRIGRKAKYQLPHEIRVAAAKYVVAAEGLADRVTILDGYVPKDQFDTTRYDAIAMGSDVFNHYLSHEVHTVADESFHSRFRNFIILQRAGFPVDEALARARGVTGEIIVHPEASDAKAREIRRRYRQQEEFESFMPASAVGFLRPHYHFFALSNR